MASSVEIPNTDALISQLSQVLYFNRMGFDGINGGSYVPMVAADQSWNSQNVTSTPNRGFSYHKWSTNSGNPWNTTDSFSNELSHHLWSTNTSLESGYASNTEPTSPARSSEGYVQTCTNVYRNVSSDQFVQSRPYSFNGSDSEVLPTEDTQEDIMDVSSWKGILFVNKRKAGIPPQNYICHRCHKKNHFVQDCPKSYPPGIEVTKYQGSNPSVAVYHCKTCKRKWLSHYSMANIPEKCRKCHQDVFGGKWYHPSIAKQLGVLEKFANKKKRTYYESL